MKVRPDDKKGDKLRVTTVRQFTATGVLHQNDNWLITNVQCISKQLSPLMFTITLLVTSRF